MGYSLITISTHFPLRSDLVLRQHRLRESSVCGRQEVLCPGMQCSTELSQHTLNGIQWRNRSGIQFLDTRDLLSLLSHSVITPDLIPVSGRSPGTLTPSPLRKLQVKLKAKQNGEMKSLERPTLLPYPNFNFSSPDNPVLSLLSRLPQSHRKMNGKRNKWLDVLLTPETSIF